MSAEMTGMDASKLSLSSLVFPRYSRAEQLADAAVHIVGLCFGAVAVIWLLIDQPAHFSASERIALMVYGTGMLGMLTASAAYNLAPAGVVKALLRRIDHAMIFIAIAATYTPFAALRLPPPANAWLCGGVWLVALMGVLLKLFALNHTKRFSMVLYIGLGWAALPALGPLTASLSLPALGLLGMGGVIYTAGTLLHIRDHIPFHNALWHAAVIIAAACHFMAVIIEFQL